MCETRARKPAPSILEKLAIYENVISAPGLSSAGSVRVARTPVATLGADVDMVQEPEAVAAGGGLITPRRLPNPCLDSPQRLDLHRELMFNQRIGKNVLNQKSELEKALLRHKEKQILNQVKENKEKETPELERIIAERARRLELAEQGAEEKEKEEGTNPTLAEVRAKLRHQPLPTPAEPN